MLQGARPICKSAMYLDTPTSILQWSARMQPTIHTDVTVTTIIMQPLSMPNRLRASTSDPACDIMLDARSCCSRYVSLTCSMQHTDDDIAAEIWTKWLTWPYFACMHCDATSEEALHMQRDRATRHKHEISHLKRLAIGKWPTWTPKVITIAAIKPAVYEYHSC